MSPKLKKILIAAGIALALMAIAFIAGWNIRAGRCQELPVADTTVTHTVKPVTLVGDDDGHVDSIVYQSYPVPVPYPVHDTTYITQHTTDTFYIMLPYQYKHLCRPDTLDVWYSGIDPKVDSARVYMHHTTEIITKPYEVVKMPPLTLELGVGTSIIGGKVGEATGFDLNPYGIGRLNLNTKHTTWSAYGMIDTKGRWGAGAEVSLRLNLMK